MRTLTAAVALLGASTCAHRACDPKRAPEEAISSAAQQQRPSQPQVASQPQSAPQRPPQSAPHHPPEPEQSQAPSPTAPSTSAGEWTAGIVQRVRQRGVQTQVGVRFGKHVGYERVVFEFDESVPGYHLEYIDKPVRDCAAGHVRPIAGDGWLEVRFEPARAHDDEGHPTLAQREFEPHLQVAPLDLILELERTCDFEAVVTWVAGVASPNRFRVLELSDPPRLVVDISTS